MKDTDPFSLVFTRICHVKTGLEDRRAHIEHEFARRGVPVNFFLDHDVSDISSALRSAVAEDHLAPSVVSLALKHQGIWAEFLASGMPYCLVFEDDVFLAGDFVPKLARCIEEIGDPDRFCAVYLGNAGNYYTPLLRLKRGRHLYPAPHCRCTDSYVITRPVAEARLRWLEGRRFVDGIDHQIDIMDVELEVETLWFERPIVEQGTHTGAFASSLPMAKYRPLWLKRSLWMWKKYTRQIKGHVGVPYVAQNLTRV